VTASSLHPVVVKVGGKAIDDPVALAAVAASLAAAAQSTPIVVVHGGGIAVDRRLAANGGAKRIAGLRITPSADMEIISDVLGREVNGALVRAINSAGQRAVGLTLDRALATCALLRGPEGEDLGRVGQVTGGDPGAIRALLAEGVTPVIACIGRDDEGPLNVNADSAAAGVARFTEAKLVALLTDTPGVLDASGATIPNLDARAIEALIASGVIHSGMIPKVRAAFEVAQASGAPALITSWAVASDGGATALGSALSGLSGGAGTRIAAGCEDAAGRRRPTGAASP
jgi:acetylglutamate kinase